MSYNVNAVMLCICLLVGCKQSAQTLADEGSNLLQGHGGKGGLIPNRLNNQMQRK